MLKTLISLLLIGIALSGCTPLEQTLASQGYRTLQGDELTRLFVGNTDYTSTGEYWYYRADGKILGTSRSGRTVDGKWKQNDAGTICINWNDAYLPSGCSKYFINDATGQIVWLEPDGQNSKANLKPGNPKNFK